MASLLYRFGAWLLQRLSMSVIIGVLALCACSLWLFMQDQRSEETRREQWIHQLTRERDAARAALSELESRLSADEAALFRQEGKAARTAKIIAKLDQLKPGLWGRLFGNKAQQQANAAQRANLMALHSEAQARIVELQVRVTGGHGGRLDAILRLQNAEQYLEEASKNESQIVYYLRSAWLDIRWYLGVGLLVLFFGPFVVKLWLYFGWARLTGKSEPMQLSEGLGDPVHPRQSAEQLNESLWPGQVLRAPATLLVSEDDGLEKKERGLLSWAFPLSCWWSGQTGLHDWRHRQAGSARELSLTTPAAAEAPPEMLVVLAVPEGASFSLRLSLLAGWIFSGETAPRIRRKWRLFSRQAWVSGQYRYFDFEGPGRLILRAAGLRAETLTTRVGVEISEKRVSSRSVVGFSSSFKVSPVRTDSFWHYLTGANKLWQSKFTGSGVILMSDSLPHGFWRRLGRKIGL